ncbi:diguanylate cyclase [Aliikangiella marina]|uniref:Diguanylate cyclase n=1 Tax=Aliikangiella marina TaxID=1712262 RepID=A0A545T511_9GAMM|nr:sensor domain-containing diguanylate cyclase [Aliikangiella marina]TQV72306.1 diguanylate cyclase [Aliikangiella marina]
MNTSAASRQNYVMDIDHPTNEPTNDLSSIAIQHAGNGIVVTDADNTILQVNPAFCRISGFKEAEIVGRKPFLLRSGEHDESFYNRIWKVLHQDGFWQGEICYRHRQGGLFYVWETITAIQDKANNITHYVSAMTDMTELKQQQQALSELANYDALTQLPNRHYFSANLKQSLEMSKRHDSKVALLFIDLNKFKAINDQYGHRAGDNLLVEVAERIARAVRTEDTAARIGGDEFVVLMPRVSARYMLESIANRILKRLSPPIQIAENLEINLSASIGISVYPDDLKDKANFNQARISQSDDDAEILELADQAMYVAKENSLPFCFYDQIDNYQPKSREDLVSLGN